MSSTAKALIDGLKTPPISVVPVWEMVIKVSLDKLEMPSPFTAFIDEQPCENTIVLLDIKTAYTGIVVILLFHHCDPFDRLIIAQSQVEDFPIIGKEAIFDDYEIKCL